jgi:hypothetical protein
MKKTAFVLFLGLFIISWSLVKFSNNKVYASPPAPTPECYVEGTIQDVRFEKAHDNSCVKEKSCPTDVPLSYPDAYYLSVEINRASLSKDTRSPSFRSCDDIYPTGTTQEIFITKDNMRAGESFSRGQRVTGIAVSFWGRSFRTYNISGQSTDNITSDSRYGHAKDYSWISGRLRLYPLEGGCWSIEFSSERDNEDNYNGILGLKFDDPRIANTLRDGSFVTVRGKVREPEISMACPLYTYSVTSVEDKEISGVIYRTKLFLDRVINSIFNLFVGNRSDQIKRYKIVR